MPTRPSGCSPPRRRRENAAASLRRLQIHSRTVRSLPRRLLGRTGVTVPVLGLGTAPAGHRPEREAVAFFRQCIDSGVTHLDTGPQCGGFGNAQILLGQLLKDGREVFVATRCCEPDGEQALAQLKQDLTELRIDQADLVYVQSIGDDNMVPEKIFASGGVCQALDKARRDGLTRLV